MSQEELIEDLKVVQKYVSYVSTIGQPWREYMCSSCDSELPLQPGWSEQNGIFLWCLGYGCPFKRILGYTTISEMRTFLEDEKVIPRS